MDCLNFQDQCNALRQELKAWEKDFALQHDGRKAGRDDIKANAAISQKYKEYNKLREVMSGKTAPQTPSKRCASRKPTQVAEQCIKSQPRSLTTTPQKRKRDSGVDLTEENIDPSELLSPQGPTLIGPTPQRDGIVLGLFDLLPSETPSKRRAVLSDVSLNVLQTPSRKHNKAESEASVELRARGEKTPQSVGKRFMLDKFVTPQKRRFGDEGTPTSALKGLSTPAFLRRDNVLSVVDEEDVQATPRAAPWKRRGFGRSLSSMIQSMKKQEEDRLDEEAEIMAELEMEEMGISLPKKAKTKAILVQDSQPAVVLDQDGFVPSEDEQDEQDGQDESGQPTRIWKKRGQKRQTRRVIMRPNFAKPKPEPTMSYNDEDSEPETGVQETQVGSTAHDEGKSGDESDSDYASDDSHTPKKRKVQPKKDKEAAKAEPKDNAGPVKTAARKIKATAHANYRRLKIKSKGGNGGKGGRFGYGTIWTSPPRIDFAAKTAASKQSATSRLVVRSSPSPKAPPPTSNTRQPAKPTLATSEAVSSARSSSQNPHQMAENELRELLKQLHQSLQSHKYQQSTSLLSRAKVALLNLNALIPTDSTPRKHLFIARETLEVGAVISIRLKDPVSFTRYFQQLQPFYSLPENVLPKEGGNSSKITGLYLLLLLSDGDYAGFHTLLETLEVAAAQTGKGLEEDAFIQYPIRLEQALMEGSYDRVWGETKSERVPSEEFALFSDVLIGMIRKEIASCSEKAYPSIPVADAKSLLFLDSEGSVVSFAQECGWIVKDGRIYFPAQEDEYDSKDILVTSDQVIEKTLGYARELETIV
ncbi:hypothetical protein BU24DRAFT_352730 [Aaosphaeria arxii CBS 175.79]|uniref:DNA replication regulator SLD2 n=1 Tax=Aaosphaeria arxii CBS 175.79 TaxID=1450172 RepID=A0A6A5XGY8_9PLEO|nr:uncharacterized protein BU24DRAFT_352730 [Aaosphaeria arxii CBS 175.79]KAF2012061.1 hypothetical protein BU24DRAFT_352730 [Aaosphaeria arxii CBS 175.79]